MAALDAALRRAESAAEWLGWRPPPAEPAPDAPATGGTHTGRAGLSVVALPPIKGAQPEVG